jgi:hypothetical protein
MQKFKVAIFAYKQAQKNALADFFAKIATTE